MPTDILSLSWKVQVALASGYAAYMISYRGIRGHHSAHDTVFLTLVFSLIASAELWLTRSFSPLIAGVCAFVLSVSGGLLWRRHGMEMLMNLLRDPDTTWSDDTPSAWAKLQENRTRPVSQISVLLKDGTWLRCDDTSQFNNAPYAPCVLGANGDIIMYLTSTDKDEEERIQKTVMCDVFGARLTYIPSAEISRVNIRLMTPSVVSRGRRLHLLGRLSRRFRLSTRADTSDT